MLVKNYIRAVRNDIFLDGVISQNNQLHQLTSFKALRLLKYYKKFPSIFKSLLIIVNSFWPVITLIIQTFHLFKNLTSKLGQRKVLIEQDVIFAASSRIWECLKGISLQNQPQVLLFGKCKSDRQLGTSVFALASIKDLLIAYVNSLFVFTKLPFNKWIYTYDSFEWLLSYRILNKKKFLKTYSCNHYDRWAYLFDTVISNNATIIQHGLFGEDEFPSKLKNVKHIYLINESERHGIPYFIDNKNLKVSLIESKVKLSALASDYKLSILVICNSMVYWDKELELAKALMKQDVQVYFKPHPLTKLSAYSKFMKAENFKIIDDPKVYPRTDIVLSYHSTLANIYKERSIKVVYFHEKDTSTVIKEALNVLNLNEN